MIRTIPFTAICAASLIGVFAFGTSGASAKSVTSCQATNKSSVIACCENVVAQNGKPNWMRVSGTNCRQVVKCSNSKGCYVERRLEVEQRGFSRSNRKSNPT